MRDITEKKRPEFSAAPTADCRQSILVAKGCTAKRVLASKLLMLGVVIVLACQTQISLGQSINRQKKSVVFIFGTVHPLNPDKTPMRDANGNPLAVPVPLGTGFFVAYPDRRGGPHYEFSYLVTAKHVLQDADGSYLPSVSIRLNLKSPVDGSDVGFIHNIPVTDSQGSLTWFHSEDPAEDVVVLPLFPDEHQFEFTTISTRMFMNDRALSSGDVAEGDDLYFIGLMEQYYGIKRNHPLVKRGTVALLTDEYIETPSGRQKIFIAELESWPGNSGSPVFLFEGLRDKPPVESMHSSFLGMVVAIFQNRISIPLVGTQLGRQLEGGDRANTGMTCIVPATIIEEILNSSAAQQDRDARIGRLSKVVR